MTLVIGVSGGAVISVAVVIVVTVALVSRLARRRMDRVEVPATRVTLDATGRDRGPGDWPTTREAIVHGDPFASEYQSSGRFSLAFVNAAGCDALDVEIDFRRYAEDLAVAGTVYRHDRMVEGVSYPVAVQPGAAIQGRIPLWVTYTIDGDPNEERHTIDLSVVAP